MEPSAASCRGSRTTRVAIAIALAALTWAVFAPVRHHGFVDLDDLGMVLGDATLRPDSLGDAFARAFTTPVLSNWMPLTVLSLQLDFALYGEEPGGYLVTNVALHALASLALFFALVALTGATWRSAFVAAVFAVHPLHVETAAWLGERKGALSGLGFMAALWTYARYAARPSPGRYAAVLAAFALALLAKPIVVTLPFALLLLDYWPLRRLGWKAVGEKAPLFALSAAASAVTFAVQRDTGAMVFAERVPFAARCVNAVDAYAVYLRQSVWPADLVGFYPHARDAALSGRVAGEALALVGVTAAVIALRRTRPYLVVGWLWFLGTLIPVLGLVQVGLQSHADRYMYLPLVGLAIAAAWGGADLARTRVARRAVGVAAAAAVAACAVAAHEQLAFWRSPWAFWERVVALSPDDPRGYKSLAVLHARAERFDEAEALFAKAYALDPVYAREYVRAYYLMLAQWHARRGHADESLANHRRAVEIDPQHPEANRLLGLDLMRRQRADEARPFLEAALAGQPDDAAALGALVGAAQREGRYAEAVAYLQTASERAPGSLPVRVQLARLLATVPDAAVRDPAAAVRLAEAARDELTEPSLAVLDTLALAYAAAGRFDDAIAAGEGALALAEAGGHEDWRRDIAERLARYRSEPPRGPLPDRAPGDSGGGPAR